jgi:hypothetical protein
MDYFRLIKKLMQKHVTSRQNSKNKKETMRRIRISKINFSSGDDEKLKYFLEQEIVHSHPRPGTLSFIVLPWIIGIALTEEYEEGKLVLEGFVEQYRGNRAFSCSRALEALFNKYCSLKLFKGKWFEIAAKDVLDEIEKHRKEILNFLTKSIKHEVTSGNKL